MANTVLLFGALLAGALVVDYGVKNTKTAFAASTSTTGQASPPAAGTPTGAGGSLEQEVSSIASKHNWSASEVTSWMYVIGKEDASASLTATNSSTGAYGVGQFLAPGSTPSNVAPDIAKYAQYGGDASTLTGQLEGMANYIEQTYGTPSVAAAHERDFGWY